MADIFVPTLTPSNPVLRDLASKVLSTITFYFASNPDISELHPEMYRSWRKTHAAHVDDADEMASAVAADLRFILTNEKIGGNTEFEITATADTTDPDNSSMTIEILSMSGSEESVNIVGSASIHPNPDQTVFKWEY